MAFNPSNIIFDMDGVIADTSGCHARAYRFLWDELGIPPPEYAVIAGRSTKEVVKEYTESLSPTPSQISEWVIQKQIRARQFLEVEPIAFDDSAYVINKLSKQYRLALATSASRESTHLILRRCNVLDAFECISTAEDATHSKPDPELYLKTMSQCNYASEDTLVIEDSEHGIDAGLASGAWVVSVRSGLVRNHPRFCYSCDNLLELEFSLSNL